MAAEGLDEEVQDPTSGIAKILQHEVTVVALVKIEGSFQMMSFKVPMPCSSLGRATSEGYWLATQLVEEALGLDEVREPYWRRHNYVCTDREGAQGKARRAQVNEWASRSKKIDCTITPCDVHIKNDNRESSFAPLASISTNVRQCASMLSFSNHSHFLK